MRITARMFRRHVPNFGEFFEWGGKNVAYIFLAVSNPKSERRRKSGRGTNICIIFYLWKTRRVTTPTDVCDSLRILCQFRKKTPQEDFLVRLNTIWLVFSFLRSSSPGCSVSQIRLEKGNESSPGGQTSSTKLTSNCCGCTALSVNLRQSLFF